MRENVNWRRALRETRGTPAPRPADGFWQEFHARRAFRPQHAPPAPVRLLPLFVPPALAAACAAALLAGGLLLARRAGEGTAGRASSVASAGRHAGAGYSDDSPTTTLSGVNGMDAGDEEGGT
jgi:hypothetical protein